MGTYGTAALAVNNWTFLAETYNGASIGLWVNGVEVSTLAQTGNILTSTDPLTIGGDSIFGQYFSGLIDNVRIYNTALTQAQIQTDMTTAVTGRCSGGNERNACFGGYGGGHQHRRHGDVQRGSPGFLDHDEPFTLKNSSANRTVGGGNSSPTTAPTETATLDILSPAPGQFDKIHGYARVEARRIPGVSRWPARSVGPSRPVRPRP